jgi:hypothetical protein
MHGHEVIWSPHQDHPFVHINGLYDRLENDYIRDHRLLRDGHGRAGTTTKRNRNERNAVRDPPHDRSPKFCFSNRMATFACNHTQRRDDWLEYDNRGLSCRPELSDDRPTRSYRKTGLKHSQRRPWHEALRD